MKHSPEDLINAHFDGLLDSSQAEELNEMIKRDPAAAKKFAETAQLHEGLGSGFRSGILTTRSTHTQPRDRKPLISLLKPALPWTLAAAAGIAALVSLSVRQPSPEKPGDDAVSLDKLQDSGFALLSNAVDARWEGVLNPTTGDVLSEGTFELSSGLAQIEFFNGVSLVIEEGASFEIISEDEMRFANGKLRAHVPPQAIGFQIHTPNGTVLDLGTEFALDLSEAEPELHVIDGEVEWHPNSAPEVSLTTGKALRLSSKESHPVPVEPSRFTSMGGLAKRLADYQSDRFQKWQSSLGQQTHSPNLLAHFPITNLSLGSRELVSITPNRQPGTIIGAKSVPGRWPQKQALDFSPNGSRVRLHIPGQHQALTYSTWAKIDSLDRQFNALFLTDNYGLGEPHWQLLADGRLFFSVGLGEEKFHHIFHSPSVWDHTKTEQWLHLVTTYDVQSRTCVHYLNGQEISRETAPAEKGVEALVIGNAQIGNWGLPTREEPEFAVRNLNGRLDEFAIYNSALSPSQIQTLYLSGKP